MLVDGTIIKLGIKISADTHSSMPDVYNLAFGPFDENFEIDDEVKLAHLDHSKVFSTIVFDALSFLKANKGKYLGIDGSNIYGLNYFLRVLRDGSIGDVPEDLLVIPNLILPGENISAHKLYNYLIFNAKSEN